MHPGMRLSIVVLATFTIAPGAHGWIRMSGIFTDNMVLQTPHPGMPPARIFGIAYTSETVVVSGTNGFPGPFKLAVNKTGCNHWARPLDAPWGNWSVDLPPVTTAGPFDITVRSTTNASDSTTLHNVVFGEVFFCNGQSNMKLTVDATDNKDEEYALAVDLGAAVRVNFVSGNLSLDGPQTTPDSGNWTIASDNNGTVIHDFSAVCWGMGRRIAQWYASNAAAAAALRAPGASPPVVGLVEISVGGTTIHHWIPADAGIACNKTGMLPSRGEARQYPPGWIYEGRMNPILLRGHGFSARSVLYYQGEADSGENDVFTKQAYECELTGLVSTYRRDFGQPNLPIVVVQLPGNGGTISSQHDNDTFLAGPLATGWSAIQLAQQAVMTAGTGVGLVPLPDLGCCGLHYPHKWPVAERAANITREVALGDMTIDNAAPRVAGVTRNPSAPLSVNIQIAGGRGLHLKETYHCNATYNSRKHEYVPNVKTVTTAAGGQINVTCCSSVPSGHEGLGMVKFAVNATKHPRDYWGGWVPADVQIVSDTLLTATAVLPNGVNADDFSMVDVNLGGVGCVVANANGMPLGLVAPIAVPKAVNSNGAAGAAASAEGLRSAAGSTRVTTPPPTPPAPCACDVCDDPNPLPAPDGRVRIAALGDSITRGHPLRGKDLQFNYPCNLQRMLGQDKYVVYNFGAGGHTLLRPDPPVLNASKSVWNSTQYEKAMAVAPHVVLIMLGTNDATGIVWSADGSRYPADYEAMIAGFKALPSKPQIYAMTSPPLYNGNFAGINQTVVNKVLPPLVHQVAADAGLPPPIDVFNGMGGVNLTHHDWFWGNGSYGCHPNMQGYAALSTIVFKALQG